MAIFFFARRARKLCYYGDVIPWIVEHKDMDWKRARRCIGIVCVSARCLILCGLRAATYSRVLAIHKL